MENAGKIFTLIPKIMKQIGAVGKNQKNKAQNYRFRGIDDVYNAVQPALVENGVFISPQIIDKDVRILSNGKTAVHTVLTMRFVFYADDGSSFETSTVGEALDYSDKSANKAMSAAYKYALFQTFCIPTDEIKESEHDSPELPTDNGRDRIIADYSRARGGLTAEQVKKLHDKYPDKKSLTDFSDDELLEAINYMGEMSIFQQETA